jgi:HD-like signal output (HDOD) protein
MGAVSTSVTSKTLKNFDPIRSLDEAQLEELAQHARMEHVKRGAVLMERGTRDNWTVYLLEGQLELQAADGAVVVIEGGTAKARNPIARLQPRQYRVVSLSEADIVRLDNDRLETVFNGRSSGGYNVAEAHASTSGGFVYSLFTELYKDIQNDTLILPTLPEVGLKIRELLGSDTVSIEQIAKLIQTDPTIAAKVIKVANSPLYAGQTTVDNCKQAVTRIGTDATAQLVTSFVVKDLFQGRSPAMKQRMRLHWEHSVNVAAAAYVLARKGNVFFEAEKALLAGLLHDIGVVAILNYANKFENEPLEESGLSDVIKQLAGQIGSMMLKKWNFPDEFVTVALEAEDCMRDPAATPDLCDLILIAQLHTDLMTPGCMSIPTMHKLPAFKKLGLADLDPNVGVKILVEAKTQIAEIRQMLAY